MNKHLHIENKTGTLKLNDRVTKESADQIIKELGKLYGHKAVVSNMMIGDVVCSSDDALDDVYVEINSPGGSVFEGQRIYNAFKEMSSRGVSVTTVVNGLAASMGSVILMAGDKRKMTKGSRIMIHEASTVAMGDAQDLKKQADFLDVVSAEIAELYAERINGDPERVREMMKEETWMTAEEAKENGFIDSIIKNGKEQAEDETNNDTENNAQKEVLTFGQNETNNKPQPKNKMSVFKTNKTLKVENGVLESELELIQNEYNELEKEHEAIKAQLIEKDETIATLTAEKGETDGNLSELQNKLESVSGELEQAKEDIEKAENSTNAKAVDIAASAGHKAELIVEEESTEGQIESEKVAEALYGEYRELQKSNPRAASSFWDENKDQFTGRK